MLSYQDLVGVGPNEHVRMDFVRQAVGEHRHSEAYRIASDAQGYYAKHNVTISQYQRMLRDINGQLVRDLFGADYKLKSLFFRRFVTQQVQFVLSNGVSFERPETKSRLGKTFDSVIVRLATKALVDGVAFGFWNYDHLEVFGFADTRNDPGFSPLYDEENGMLRAGIRYWSVSNGETKRMTLYEADGFTEYIQRKDENMTVLRPKEAYIKIISSSAAGDIQSVQEQNYPGFPIIPMFANDLHDSELTGIREKIDAFDLIESGLANDIDDMSGFYWVLKNSGGMDDVDLRRFIERMHVVKAAVVEDGTEAEPHTMDIPTQAREAILNRLEAELYRDFQIVNVSELSAGAKTATEIRAAYQPMEDKCGAFEYCIRDFIEHLLALLGIDDSPSFSWNRIANLTEETQMVLTAAPYLDDETLLRKLPWMTPEEVDAVLKRKDAEDLTRLGGSQEAQVESEE